MQVIIRLSKAGQAAEAKKSPPERIEVAGSGEYRQALPEGRTEEQQAVLDVLACPGSIQFVQGNNSIRLGDFVPSTITRSPLVKPIAYDAPPGDEQIWQQLERMASQLPDMVNPSGLAF